MITGPKLEDGAEQPYVAIGTQVSMQELGTAITQLLGEVHVWLEKRGAAPAGAPFIRYRVINMAAKLDIELGFPVASAASGDARVSAGVLPASRYASLVYTGDYAGLVGANAALLDWRAEKVSCGIAGQRTTATPSARVSSPTSPTQPSSLIQQSGKQRLRFGWRAINLGRRASADRSRLLTRRAD